MNPFKYVNTALLIVFTLCTQPALASHSSASASAADSLSTSAQVHVCPTCDNEIDEVDDVIQCEQGHPIHKDCLSVQVNHTKNFRDLKENGLRCGGAQCTQKHPFDKIIKALSSSQIEEINKTLVKKELKNLGIQDESCAICLEGHQIKKEIAKLGCDCKKGFCQECIQPWLESRRDGACPTCRAPFNGLTVHQLDASLEIIDPSLTSRPSEVQANVVNAEQAPAAAAAQPPQNEGIPRLVQNVQGISPAFAALGDTYESGGLIWSGVVQDHEEERPEERPGQLYRRRWVQVRGKMNWQDAVNFCASLSRGTRLPTADEYRALRRAMSPGGQYSPGLLPESRWRGFWSSSHHGDQGAFYFNGSYGDVFIANRSGTRSVRCVRATRGY